MFYQEKIRCKDFAFKIFYTLFFLLYLFITFAFSQESNPFNVREVMPNKNNQKKAFLKKNSKNIELNTVFIPVNYAIAKEIAEHLENIISNIEGANLSVDVRSNTIIVTDTPDVIKKAKNIIQTLDKVTKQVLIEAKIVEANSDFSRELGIKWNLSSANATGSDGVINYETGVNLPTQSTSSIGVTFNKISSDKNKLTLDAKLLAMETDGKGKIVASPKILTKNNKEAIIKQGVEYPYLKEIDQDGVSKYALKSLFLTLKVTPHITQDRKIILKIHIQKGDLGNTISGRQSFLNKEAKTELLVRNNETIIIGGIFKTVDRDEVSVVPCLYKIPFLGFLFKSKKKVKSKEELIVFITPKIIDIE